MFNRFQLESINLNLVFVSFYLLLLIVKPTAARIKVFAAVVVCVIVGYSPLYMLLNNTQFYSLLSFIYIIACLKITNKKVSATCCIMAIFEFTMVIDRLANAGIETWLYIHFEEITLIIHALVISSFFKWELERWRSVMGSIASYVLGVLHYVRHTSRL